MNPKLSLWLLTAILLVLTSQAEAQQPTKIAHIGFISPSSPSSAAANIQAFEQALRELGYVEGKNVVLDVRFAEGSTDRLANLVTKVVHSKLDVLVVGGAAGAIAAKKSGSTIPVVFAAVTDPLGYGIVDSLARPGGNITGVALSIGEKFSGKWVELLKEALPNITRVAVLRNPTHPLAAIFLRETQTAGRALKIAPEFLDAQEASQISPALSRSEKEGIGALIVTPDPLFTTQRTRIVEFVTRHRLPSMFFAKEFVEAGGLLSYVQVFLSHTAVLRSMLIKSSKAQSPPIYP
jgi:putative ABC transport system substrate-binding protein